MASKDIKTYDEVYDKPLVAYETTDCYGNKVIIKHKNPEHHCSSNELEQWAPIFHNLGYIVKHPSRVRPTSSKNPKALKNKKRGKILVFIKDNFISDLDLPGKKEFRDETHVVVMYDKTKKKNYTLTYSIYSK